MQRAFGVTRLVNKLNDRLHGDDIPRQPGILHNLGAVELGEEQFGTCGSRSSASMARLPIRSASVSRIWIGGRARALRWVVMVFSVSAGHAGAVRWKSAM